MGTVTALPQSTCRTTMKTQNISRLLYGVFVTLQLVLISLPQPAQSAPVPAPTTVMVDLLPLGLGSLLVLKGIFVGNSLAHLANDRGKFNQRKTTSASPVVLGGPLIHPPHLPHPHSYHPVPYRHLRSLGVK